MSIYNAAPYGGNPFRKSFDYRWEGDTVVVSTPRSELDIFFPPRFDAAIFQSVPQGNGGYTLDFLVFNHLFLE